MHSARLRKVGGSVMLAVPPAILELLKMQAGTDVGLAVEGARLVIEATPYPRYTLTDLLAQCDPAVDMSDEEKAWLDARPQGGELI